MRTLPALALLLLGACTGPAVIDDVDDDDDTSADEGLTYYPDVQPMVDQACVRCHQPGGVGPFDFSDGEAFASFAERAVARLDAGTMPPATSDPECHEYIGQEHLNAPDGMADVVRQWIADGKVMGDPAEAVEVEAPETELAEVDLEVRIEAPYAPTYSDPKDLGNEYRCFYLDPADEDIHIGGLHPIVDNAAMVHHIVLFTVADSEVPEGIGAEGEDCLGMGSGADGMIAAWAPGMLPVELPEGAAITVEEGRTLVLQMHYYDAADPGATDQSGYAFDLVDADSVTDDVFMLPLGAFNFTLPAGDDDARATNELELPAFAPTVKVYASFPHMHYLGTSYKFWFEREGVETCLVQSDVWDFNNQLTYQFPEPVEVQGGDTLKIECTYDNSADNPNNPNDPPKDVGYGERTDEEMCYSFTLVSLGD